MKKNLKKGRKNSKKIRIVITGGAGALGFHLLEKLKEDKFEVVVLDKKAGKNQKNVKFFKCDLADSDISGFLKDADYVFHLASIIPQSSDISVEECLENVNMAANVAKNNKKAKVIYASTNNVYGVPKRVPIKESDFPEPTEIYGLSKLCGERVFESFSKKFGWPLVIFRIANVYGPDFKRKEGILFKFFSKLVEDEPIEIHGKGSQKRDRVWFEDVVSAFLLAMKKNTEGTFNLGSGESYSVLEVAKLIAGFLGKKPKINFRKKEGKKRNILLDISKAKRILGYSPKTDFKSGLKSTICAWGRESVKTVYFDLDGTILDVSEKIYRVYKFILEKHGKAVLPKKEYLRLKREKTEMKEILRKTKAESILLDYKKEWMELIEKPEYLIFDELFKDRKDVLSYLKGKYDIILITSRKNRKNLYRQLKDKGLDKIFSKILAAGEGAEKREELIKRQGNCGESILVGDTETDILVARSLEMRIISVFSGMRSEKFLKKFSPDYLVGDISLIRKIIC